MHHYSRENAAQDITKSQNKMPEKNRITNGMAHFQ